LKYVYICYFLANVLKNFGSKLKIKKGLALTCGFFTNEDYRGFYSVKPWLVSISRFFVSL